MFEATGMPSEATPAKNKLDAIILCPLCGIMSSRTPPQADPARYPRLRAVNAKLRSACVVLVCFVRAKNEGPREAISKPSDAKDHNRAAVAEILK